MAYTKPLLAASATIHSPAGTSNFTAIPGNSVYGSTRGAQNKAAVHWGVPLAGGASATNQRQCITAEFMVTPDFRGHIGILGKHMCTNYQDWGDTRSLGVIVGAIWTQSPGDIGLEEVEAFAKPGSGITPEGNGHTGNTGNWLQGNKWYRVAVDICRVGNTVCYAGRVWDKATGVGVWDTGDRWSTVPANYPAGAGSVTIFRVGTEGSVTFRDIANTWGPTNEWNPNP